MLMFYAAIVETEEEKGIFARIYYRYRKQMLQVAKKYLDNHQDAEDAIHNAFVGIAHTFRTVPYENEDATRAYVLTAAKNAALAILAKKKRRTNLPPIPSRSNREDDLFEKLAATEDYDALLRCIRSLDAIYRDVILLVYVYGHTPKEAAKLLARKPETVRKQLYRGKQLLRTLCEKEGLL